MTPAIRVWHPACHSPPKTKPNLPIVDVSKYRNYAHALAAHMDDAGLIVLEHDVTISTLDLHTLMLWANPTDMIAVSYWLYPVSTGLPEPVIAHRRRGEFLRSVPTEWTAVDRCGLGCTYLPPSIKATLDRGLRLGAEWDYPALDTTLSAAWNERPARIWVPPKLFADHKHGWIDTKLPT